MGVDRQDVDDRARRAALPQIGDRRLHQEEGRASIGGEQASHSAAVPSSSRGAVGERAGIDERVDPAERGQRGLEGEVGRRRVGQLGRREARLGPGRLDLRHDRVAARRIAPADHDRLGAGAGDGERDGAADALRAAGDDDDAPPHDRLRCAGLGPDGHDVLPADHISAVS